MSDLTPYGPIDLSKMDLSKIDSNKIQPEFKPQTPDYKNIPYRDTNADLRNQISVLQNQLDKTYEQLKQANDKLAIQNGRFCSLQTDYKDEREKREAAEQKLSKRDKYSIFWSIFGGVVVYTIEHWHDFYSFISHLF